MKRNLKHAFLAMALAATAAAAAPLAYATDDTKAPDESSSQPVKDAYLKSKIVGAMAVNPHVSAMKLDVKVENGVAYLGGRAKDATERDLAVQIAKGVDGVKDVHSNIKIQPENTAQGKTRAKAHKAGRAVSDASITARVKSKLLADAGTPGTKIDVDTSRGVVTLKGTVDTDAQKDLAGKIAENTEHVVAVHNDLTVATK